MKLFRVLIGVAIIGLVLYAMFAFAFMDWMWINEGLLPRVLYVFILLLSSALYFAYLFVGGKL